MKKKLFFTFVFLGAPLLLSAAIQENTVSVGSNTMETVSASPVKTNNETKGKKTQVVFNSKARNPFLSAEDIAKIEGMKRAEELRKQKEKEAAEAAAKEAKRRAMQEEIERQERLRHPSREIIGSISVDGILDKLAIVNGEIVSRGSKVLGAEVIRITDDYVRFNYKGEKFNVAIKTDN